MKNKKLLRFLIPFTLAIWGYVGYKIYLAINKNDDVVLITSTIQDEIKKVLIDTFSIRANYPDPFLGRTIHEKHSGNSHVFSGSINTTSKAKPNLTAINNLPQIQYYGVIKSAKSNKQIAIISVNGLIGNYSVGDKFSGVEVLKINKDSIQLKFNEDKFYVKK